jgi:DNA-directed RNA polymerase alpha subunit
MIANREIEVSPQTVVVDRIKLHLMKTPSEFDAARSALDEFEREWMRERAGRGEFGVRDMWLTETELSVRICEALERNGVRTVGELLELTSGDIKGFRGFSTVTISEIYKMLDGLGFHAKEPAWS